METKEMISVNIDKTLKEETIHILDGLGLDVNDAITMYFQQIVDRKDLPFEVHYSVEEIAGENWRPYSR